MLPQQPLRLLGRNPRRIVRRIALQAVTHIPLPVGARNYSEEQVVNAIAPWCHSGGDTILENLVNRRLREAFLFLYGLIPFLYVAVRVGPGGIIRLLLRRFRGNRRRRAAAALAPARIDIEGWLPQRKPTPAPRPPGTGRQLILLWRRVWGWASCIPGCGRRWYTSPPG